MPATTPRGAPYPTDADPVDVAADIQRLAAYSDNETVRRFETVDALKAWPNPPQGAMAWAKVSNTNRPDEGLYFQYQYASWWPIGDMLYTTMGADWTVPVDNAWHGVPWTTAHINVGLDNYPVPGSHRWRAPYSGVINVVSSLTLALRDTGGNWAMNDFHGSISVLRRAADTTILHWIIIGNFFGRFAINRLYGSAEIQVNAGETYEIAIYVGSATGFVKQVAGGDHGCGMSIHYVGTGLPGNTSMFSDTTGVITPAFDAFEYPPFPAEVHYDTGAA